MAHLGIGWRNILSSLSEDHKTSSGALSRHEGSDTCDALRRFRKQRILLPWWHSVAANFSIPFQEDAHAGLSALFDRRRLHSLVSAAGIATPRGRSYRRRSRSSFQFRPEDTIDLLVRVLADHIGKTHGQTIIVESRPGAGSIIAAEAVARAAPDGGTLLVNSNGMMISSKIRKVNFDPLTSYEPICYLVNSPQVIVVNSDSSYRTLADFLDAATRQAGRAVARERRSTDDPAHRDRKLKRLAKVDLTYVPFTGGAPAINALLGGHITAVLQNYSEVGEQLNAGKLRALATPSTKRIEPLPDLPTDRRIRIQGFRRRGLVRSGGAGEDPEGHDVATDRHVR